MSARRNVTPIVLIALALAMVAYVWFVERGAVTEAERGARTASVFPVFRSEEVTRVELARGGEKLVLERDGAMDSSGGLRPGDASAWRITSPRAHAANPVAIDRLLHDLELAPRVREVDGDGAGLGAPRVRGAVSMGKTTYLFALGDAAPTPAGAAYFRFDGGRAMVVKKELVDALLQPLDAYRDRTLLTYGSHDLARVEVSGGAGGGFVVERANETDFRLTALGLRASRAALEKVWSALAEIRAEAFVDDAEADRATNPPVLTVVATPRDPSRTAADLVVGAPCAGHPDDVVLVRKLPLPRVSACVPKGIIDGLGATPTALVDTHLFAAHEDEVAELRLEAPLALRVLDVARSGSGWHERAPRDHVLSPDEVEAADALVRALVQSEGQGVSKEATPSSAPVVVRVTLRRADHTEHGGDEIVEVRAPDANGVAFARRVDDGAVLRITPEVLRALTPRDGDLRARALWSPPIDSRPLVALATRCHGLTQEIVHGDLGWSMRSPSGYRADPAAVLDLANAVMRAKADAWVADADEPSFGFTKASCAVALTVADEGGTRKVGLVFGADVGGGHVDESDAGSAPHALVYAHVEGDAAVFVAPRSLRDMAARILVDRGALALDVDDVTTMTLTRDGARSGVVLARDAASGRLTTRDARDSGAAALEDGLRAALETLRADDVLHLGPPAKDEGFDHPTLEIRVAIGKDAGGARRRLAFGALTSVDREMAYYARVDGVDATFAVAKQKLEALFSSIASLATLAGDSQHH